MKINRYSNLIQLNAESIGIKTLDNEIMDYLNIELEEKMKIILAQAKKYMRVSKRKTLKVDDLNNSIKFYNFKPIYGYDSYANVEYEKIDPEKELWRQKQNIIDLDDYLSKPITSCPMQVIPHFHWIAIDGKRPNIPENFIREEYKTVPNQSNPVDPGNDVKLQDIKNNNIINNIEMTNSNLIIQNNIVINEGENGAIINNGQKSSQKSNKAHTPIIHNISKELQIFYENFEDRFIKEIKLSKMNPFPLFSLTKEMEKSLNVLKIEPGIVELLPYIIEFLMTTITNQQYIKEAKVHMIVLYTLKAILSNQFFYIEPYVHQIITLVLSIVLLDIFSESIDLLVFVKDFAVKLVKKIYYKYETKYPNFINHLLDIFKENIVIRNGNYMTVYGAIKSINKLGPSHIINLIIPDLEKLTNQLNISKDEDNLSTKMDKQKIFSEKGGAFVFNALKEAATLTLNYIANTNVINKEKIFNEIIECFGEDILPNVINTSNIEFNLII